MRCAAYCSAPHMEMIVYITSSEPYTCNNAVRCRVLDDWLEHVHGVCRGVSLNGERAAGYLRCSRDLGSAS